MPDSTNNVPDDLPVADDELLPEYDLSGSRPNPYAERYARGTNLVRLDPEVAKIFPDAEAVNRVLKALAAIIEERERSHTI